MLGSRGMLLALGAGVLALCACSRSPQPATSGAGTTEPAASVPEPASTAELPRETEPPAESGLAIKRGVAMLASDRATFRPCDEKAELWMIDQTDGVLARAFAAELHDNTPLKLYLEAYGERGPVAEDVPAARAYGGTFVLEEALYAAPEGQGGGCGTPAQDYIVAARGSEPFWAIEVSETNMLWRQPDEPKEIALGAPQMQDSEGAVRYAGNGNGHTVELMIDAQVCRDPMSGEYFAYAARATLDGKTFNGCARVGK